MKKLKNNKDTSQANKHNKVEGVRGGFYTEEGYMRLKTGGRKGGQTTKLIRDRFKPRCRNVWCWVDEDIPAKWKAFKETHSLFERWEAMDREIMNSIERFHNAKEVK